MPYTTLVLTAGISVFAPRNVFGKRFRETGSPLVFHPGKQNPEPADPSLTHTQQITSCREWAKPILSQNPFPSEISAEFSILHAIATHGKGLSTGALVHLIHTPTLGGRLAVEIQRDLIESRLHVQCHPVELSVPFDPSQPGGLTFASGAFIGQISSLLKNSDPRTTAFAPIGGYKSMVALGHIAASFHGFPSLYIHEDSQTLQEISPAPIRLSDEIRSTISKTARLVGNGAEMNTLPPEHQAIIKEFPSFFRHVDELVELNELGQFLRLDSLPVLLDPAAEKERNHFPAMIDAQIRQIATIAAIDPTKPSINHDLKGNHGRAHPWRLARMGDGIRIAWQTTPQALLIGKIWRNHDTYEKEAPKWVLNPLPKSTKTWIPFS